MKRFLAAIRFLTIAPIPGTMGTAEADLAGSVPFFPVVGLLLGIVAAGAAFGLSHVAGPMVTAAATIVILLAFSGGLHMDGLSDTADGFLSARPRERILEIMRDSHVGAMGVMAIVCVLMVKFAALAELAGAVSPVGLPGAGFPPVYSPGANCGGWFGGTGLFWKAAMLVPLAGRTAMVIQMALLSYVRPEGLGKVFCAGRAWASALWSIAVLSGVGTVLLGIGGLVAAAACVAAAAVLAAWCKRKIGGATGDTFGAACEIGEVTAALVLAGCRW